MAPIELDMYVIFHQTKRADREVRSSWTCRIQLGLRTPKGAALSIHRHSLDPFFGVFPARDLSHA